MALLKRTPEQNAAFERCVGFLAEMIEKYKALTPYLRIRTETQLNFFAADSREMIGLLNQYAEGAIDLDRFIARYAAMARMMQLESAAE